MANSVNNEVIHVFAREKIHEIGPMFDEVMTFFEGKTKGKRMPERSDFTPVELMKYLPNMTLLELKLDDNGDVEDVFCRVCGSHCAIIYGEVTGIWLSQHDNQEMFKRVRDRCQMVVDKKQEFAVTAQVRSQYQEVVTFRALYVPLAQDNQNIDKIITFMEIDKTFETQNVAY